MKCSTSKKKRIEQEVSSEDDLSLSGSGNTINPMQNPVVLWNLFQVCRSEDLPQFRLVSKEWYSLSLTRCQRDMTVNVVPSNYRERDYAPPSQISRSNKWLWLNSETLTNELNVEDKPFCFRSFKFKLFHISFRSNHDHGSQCECSHVPIQLNVNKFWNNLGQNIRKLELCQCSIYSVEVFKKVIFKDTPNLEELKIVSLKAPKGVPFLPAPDDELENDIHVQPNLKSFRVDVVMYFPLTWRVIFVHFPNIQRLKIKIKGTGPGSHRDIINSIGTTLEQFGKRSKILIRHLAVEMQYSNCLSKQSSAVKRLVQLPQLKLESLNISLDNIEDKECSVLPTVLQLHMPNLKELSVSGAQKRGPYDNFPFSLENLPFLTKLFLTSRVICNFHFLEQMPNLTSLVIARLDRKTFEKTDLRRMDRVRVAHLREVRFWNGIHIPEAIMEMLVKVMPNVEKFQGSVSPPSFRVLCEHWAYLRHVRIYSGVDDNMCPLHDVDGIGDEAVTGIVGWTGNKGRLPNITHLTRLEDFYMFTRGTISDISIWEGFLEVPQLRELTIHARVPKGISNGAFRALDNHCTKAMLFNSSSRRRLRNSSDSDADDSYEESSDDESSSGSGSSLTDSSDTDISDSDSESTGDDD